MTLSSEDVKILENVPAGSWPMVIQFAQTLTEMHQKKINTVKQKRDKPRLIGALKGKIWMSDDFNDPLEFVSEEEMRLLETMRAGKKSEAQGETV